MHDLIGCRRRRQLAVAAHLQCSRSLPGQQQRIVLRVNIIGKLGRILVELNADLAEVGDIVALRPVQGDVGVGVVAVEGESGIIGRHINHCRSCAPITP